MPSGPCRRLICVEGRFGRVRSGWDQAGVGSECQAGGSRVFRSRALVTILYAYVRVSGIWHVSSRVVESAHMSIRSMIFGIPVVLDIERESSSIRYRHTKNQIDTIYILILPLIGIDSYRTRIEFDTISINQKSN